MRMKHISKFLTLLTFVIIAGGGLSALNAQILLQDSFEKPALDGNIWDVTWWTPSGQLDQGIEPEIVDSPVRAGKHAVKIRAQANWNGHSDYSRTEIQGKRNDTGSHNTFFYPGKEYWIGFSIYLPSDWQADYKSREVIFQLHGNGGGGQYGIPPLALIVDGDDWLWGISSDQDPTPDEADEYGRTSLIKGEWVDFVIHAKFSYSNDGYGFYEFWRNGKTLFTRNGPNCYNDAAKIRGPQTGIYKWDWSQSGVYEVSDRTMYLDEIKVGGANSSYEDVAPGGETPDESGEDSNYLSLNKPVTFSSQENDSSRAAANVVDGISANEDKRWSASPMPQWVEVDLGREYLIKKTELVCMQGRAYHFKVEIRDNNDSLMIVDRLANSDSGTLENPISDEFKGVVGRHVRLTVVGAETYEGTWASITEFSVYGDPGQVPDSGQAGYPSPIDSSEGISVNTLLSWTADSAAVSHNVYFGMNNPPEFAANQTDTTYNPGELQENTTYYWRVDEVSETDTTEGMLWKFKTGRSTAAEHGEIRKPQKYKLGQNYPNPFNPTTRIAFSLPKAAQVKINVYDVRGGLVRTLLDERQNAGSREVVFNGAGLSSGIYFYRMQAGNYSEIKRMLLIK